MKWYGIGEYCGRGIPGWRRRMNQEDVMPPHQKHLWFPYNCVRRTWWQDTHTGLELYHQSMEAPRWVSNRHNRTRSQSQKQSVEQQLVEQQLNSWSDDVVTFSTKRV